MNIKLEGNWGEALAAEFLQKKKFEIITMGFRCRMGEIDIIAKDKEYLVFAEVKTRKDDLYGSPRDFVTPNKISRIRITAEIYLQTHETALQPRFDVIEILAPKGVKTKNPKITHLEDAF